MKDPYALIRELIFRYKGKPKEEITKAVLKAFKEEYGIYLPDLNVPYEELVHYIREGKEDEAYNWFEQYLYMYLLERLEVEQRMEEEKAREIGEKILNFLRQKRIRLFGEVDPEKAITKLIEDYDKLSRRYRELQKELARLKKKYAEAESKFEKTKSPFDLRTYLETAKAVEEQTKKLKEELERLKKENEELKRKIAELSKITPEAKEIKLPEIKNIEEDIRRKEEEIKKEASLYERIKELIPTMGTERLKEWYEKIEDYFPGYSLEEYEKTRELIREELKRRGVHVPPKRTFPRIEEIEETPQEEKEEMPRPITPIDKKTVKVYLYGLTRNPNPELVKIFIMLDRDLNLGITHYKDFENIDDLIRRARATLALLAKVNPGAYELLKEKYKGLLPPDIFREIFFE